MYIVDEGLTDERTDERWMIRDHKSATEPPVQVHFKGFFSFLRKSSDNLFKEIMW